MPSTPFWADDLDVDLPNLLPHLDDVLGSAGDIALWTHSGLTHGRINAPAVWNADRGFTAFFGLTPGTHGKPEHYSTEHELVECTWREAVRDAWPHTYTIHVDGQDLWAAGALTGVFNGLMYDLRGWTPLYPGGEVALKTRLSDSLAEATAKLVKLRQDRLVPGAWVCMPNRMQPGQPGYESAAEIFGQPGRMDSVDSQGWAMVGRGSWGQFGFPIDELQLADEPSTSHETVALVESSGVPLQLK